MTFELCPRLHTFVYVLSNSSVLDQRESPKYIGVTSISPLISLHIICHIHHSIYPHARFNALIGPIHRSLACHIRGQLRVYRDSLLPKLVLKAVEIAKQNNVPISIADSDYSCVVKMTSRASRYIDELDDLPTGPAPKRTQNTLIEQAREVLKENDKRLNFPLDDDTANWIRIIRDDYDSDLTEDRYYRQLLEEEIKPVERNIDESSNAQDEDGYETYLERLRIQTYRIKALLHLLDNEI